MDFVAIAKGFASFLKELGITDPYVILVLFALLGLAGLMAWNNFHTLKTIKASNKDTSKAQSETIALLQNHHKICVDQHNECKEGHKELQNFIMNYLLPRLEKGE